MPPLIYAVTLNWNRPADTIACLQSLSTQTAEALHLVVVDNGSTDDSIAQIRASFPQIDLIVNSQNKGFACGMNVGIRHALAQGAEAVFVLNNDTILAEDAVVQLMAQCRPGVGLVAPLIYYADPDDVIWSVGGKIHPWTLEVTGDQRDVRDDGQFTAVQSRDFVPGCGMLLTRSALQNVGLFDEKFFMYYEDSDLCLRLRRAGYEILVTPHARMWHKVASSSGGSDSPNERYWMARSSMRYFSKHAHWYQIPIILFWRMGSAIRTSYRLLRRNQHEAFRAYWRGLWAGFRDRQP